MKSREAGADEARERNMNVIREALLGGHPNPEGFLEWASYQSDEVIAELSGSISGCRAAEFGVCVVCGQPVVNSNVCSECIFEEDDPIWED